MRLVYLCAVDPPPPDSDFTAVQEFFESLPEYLQPTTREKTTPHFLWFADRMGANWLPEFHDFAIVFLSERLLTDEKSLNCLGRAKQAFPSMIGIDLYNNLSSEMRNKASEFTKRIFSLDEGKEFLLTTFPQIAAAYDLENKELSESIESEGYAYLDSTISELKEQSKTNKTISFVCYGLAFIVLCALIVFTFWRFCILTPSEIPLEIQKIIVICVEVVVLSALTISLSRFLLMLGKSFMVESIRSSDRAHAIGLGRLYLKLFKSKFKWEELRDVLQNWNIDKGSAFINLDAKELESVKLDDIVSVFKKQ